MSLEIAKQAIIKITGKVQGVFYRAYAREQALSLGLTGYARNMDDGSVEILVQGKEVAIKGFIQWCQKGSPSAKVDGVSVKWDPTVKLAEGFRIF